MSFCILLQFMRCGLFGSDLSETSLEIAMRSNSELLLSWLWCWCNYKNQASILAFILHFCFFICPFLQVSWPNVNLLPGPKEGTFLFDFTPLPGNNGFFMQSGGRPCCHPGREARRSSRKAQRLQMDRCENTFLQNPVSNWPLVL